ESIVPKEKLSYILGNPPFGGKHLQSTEQKNDISLLMKEVNNCSDLDYVAGWFYIASKYIVNTKIEVSFVSTNSVVQGEQVSLLWNALFNYFNIKINFAHNTFKWKNEAKGVAAVHCVIIGFAHFNRTNKYLFDYDSLTSEPHERQVDSINQYLTTGPIVFIDKRKFPICNSQVIKYGNKPTDNGLFIFNDGEKEEFLKFEPNAKKYFKRFIGSYEFINNISRWCLWLKDADPTELKSMPHVLYKIDEVKKFRLNSSAAPTVKSAQTPSLFFYISQPDTDYLVIPETSSERRKYIPIGFEFSDTIASNALYIIPSANLYTFGVMCSQMHMAWTKTICGRLKSDYRYSGSIVYNNFPWPENPSEKNIKQVEEKAQTVLDVRNEFSGSSLADLYDPLTMPPKLVKAHNQLDKAVDRCYRSQPFVSDMNRMEFLFELYEKYTNGMFQKEKKPGKKKSKESAVEADQKNIVN
ncbi:MAG TPA: class I SAM-dependent DNA methyltransferase, partial [Spirochaetota bacterium]|nr:class I SAM-dependent DNA methyltransferase [Spirochaetota bacterium]